MPRARQRRLPSVPVEGRDDSPETLARLRDELEAGFTRLHAQLEAKRLNAPPHAIEAEKRAEAVRPAIVSAKTLFTLL